MTVKVDRRQTRRMPNHWYLIYHISKSQIALVSEDLISDLLPQDAVLRNQDRCRSDLTMLMMEQIFRARSSIRVAGRLVES